MKGQVEIIELGDGIIEIMGKVYYPEEHVKELRTSEYKKGIRKHAAEIRVINGREA